MIFDRTVGLFLQPSRPPIPYREILRAWLDAGFDAPRCREALERIIARRRLPGHFFDPPAIERGGMAATEALLFDACATTERFTLVVMRAGSRAFFGTFPKGEVATLAELIRQAARTDDVMGFRERFASLVEPRLLDALLCAGTDQAARPLWPEASRPGIYRREHASVLIRSREASVLVDPLCLALGRFPSSLSGAPVNLGTDRLDAIAITHTHEDHWHLPSVLLHAQGPAMPVIVPQVPTLSILAPEDPAESLRLAGQHPCPLPWDSVLTIGDIEIDILPFYGEQPTRLPPGPIAELRNWGSCYRFNTPDFSALLLVDSGADPAGDMAEVVERSARERGPVDALLGCVQEFPSPFFGGIATECLTLPFGRLQALFRELVAGRMPSTTAGVAGIPGLCQRSGARYYLPYANGFAALGRDNRIDWGSGPSEAAVVSHLMQILSARGVPTRAMAWNPGDAALFTGRELSIVRCAAHPWERRAS